MDTKFKKGQWITNKILNSTGCVRSIENSRYEIELTDGSKAFPDIDYIDRNFHLWTIEEAVKGDVLFQDLIDGFTFIYEGINENNAILYSFIIHGGENIGNYSIGKKNTGIGVVEENRNIIHPATSEQRNILWQKMREKGYKWNSHTKEVVKAPFKLEGTLFSAADRGKIDEIIFALKNLEQDKMLCYVEEIKFLERIKKL